jgi:hypothetical protein
MLLIIVECLAKIVLTFFCNTSMMLYGEGETVD